MAACQNFNPRINLKTTTDQRNQHSELIINFIKNTIHRSATKAAHLYGRLVIEFGRSIAHFEHAAQISANLLRQIQQLR